MSIMLGFAEMAEDCYRATSAGPDLQGWKRCEDKGMGSVSDGNFFACAYEQKKTGFAAVAFRGTIPTDLRDLAADVGGIGVSLNAVVLKLQTAMDFSYQWSQRSKHLWVVGHSLGGAYAQLVAAGFNLYGITFNAPGVLHLVNQISAHPLTKLVGSVGSPAMQIMLQGIGHIDLVSYFNKAASVVDDYAFAPVANFRSQGDIVSLCGVQVGAPVKIIHVKGGSDPLNQHSMSRIVEALGGKAHVNAGSQKPK